MAESNTTASSTVKATTSVQAKKSSNIISLLAPIICILAGYIIWRFVIGAPSNFTHLILQVVSGPSHEGPKTSIARMYQGGIIVPVLIGLFLIVFTFVIERWLTVAKANGKGSNAEFIRKVQFYLADKKVDAALAECDRQKGSVGNVMKAGLRKYKAMITETQTLIQNKKYLLYKKK